MFRILETHSKKAKEDHAGDYGKITDALSAAFSLPDEALQAAAAALFRQDSVLCVCHHDEDSGYTAYIMLSNGAVAEIQLNEAR